MIFFCHTEYGTKWLEICHHLITQRSKHDICLYCWHSDLPLVLRNLRSMRVLTTNNGIDQQKPDVINDSYNKNVLVQCEYGNEKDMFYIETISFSVVNII